jgi:hypothetical protein
MIRPWSWWPLGVVPDTVVSPVEVSAYSIRATASCPMQDMQVKLEKLLMEAEDCALIAKLASDKRKRKLFERLAADLRQLAHDIEHRRWLLCSVAETGMRVPHQ